MATKACLLTQWTHADCLDTLSAAYAETGDFSQAVRWQRKALEFPNFDKREAAAERLKLYESGQPYRDQ
jgi:hypothetical protein